MNDLTLSSDSEPEFELVETVQIRSRTDEAQTSEFHASTNGYEVSEPSISSYLPTTSSDPICPVSKKPRVRRTSGEIREAKRLKEEEKERKRLERESKKSQREAQKLEQLREKRLKALERDRTRALKPDECLKHITVIIDSRLPQTLPHTDLLQQRLETVGSQTRVEQLSTPNTIQWSRRVQRSETEVVDELEPDVLHFILLPKFIELVHAFSTGEEETLCEYVNALRTTYPTQHLCLAVFGVERDYFKNIDTIRNRAFRSTVGGGASKSRLPKSLTDLPVLSPSEVELATIDLQFRHPSITLHQLEFSAPNFSELCQFVQQCTKSIANRPRKMLKRTESFNGGSRAHERLAVWKRMIAQIPNLGEDAAGAIAKEYPCVRKLVRAFERDGERMLEELAYRRGDGIGSSWRFVGPQGSKKLCTVFTATDPNVMVESAASV